MELGIGMFGDVTFNLQTNSYQSSAERLKEIIAEVRLADELKIDHFLMGEHHRADYAVAAPEIVLAALSTVTKNIKLASGVSVLSSADPVKVFQDFAMIDLLSNERAEIVAGRGSFIESFPLFGFDLQNYEALFEEKLDLLYQLNQNKIITWQGKFRAPILKQTIYPRPQRKLPIWIAVGGTPASVERAAKYGMPIVFAIIGGRVSQFKPLIDYYKEQYIHYGHDPAKMQISVHSHTAVSDSKEELFKNYYPHYAASMNRIGRERGWSPYTEMQFQYGMGKEGALFMGTSEQVAEKIIETIELFGLTRFTAHIDVGGPGHQNIMKTIELYGTKVIPLVKKHFDNL
ncbi:MAG TPA: LLM class flavin-dependent oxidoreductase [Edaphocola sp.]|nr:LLM class flavin-dependent oxidoreductase [Edaphocola sp.]